VKLWDSPWKMLLRVSIILIIAFFAASPLIRNAVTATLLPRSGFAVTADQRVLAQPGVEAITQRVVQALPQALKLMQESQGASLDKPFGIYVFASESEYTSRGACPPMSRACAFRGNLSISPRLAAELDTVPAILAHELSHVLLQQRMGMFKATRIPPWFAEGLAVMVSDGGGAEGVGQEEVSQAFKAGKHFTPDMASLPMTQKTAGHFNLPHRLFYRQAALFVKYLKEQKTAEFDALMGRLHAGMAFQDAFGRSFSQSVEVLWQEFLKAQSSR
jgi:hypothetical protein